MNKTALLDFFRRTANTRSTWKKRNRFYHRSLENYFSFIIPKDKKVLEIGCGHGDLLHSVFPSFGVGIDFAPENVDIAKKNIRI
jgi:ubiquinone/menaquinone biosynthesis C-methylase UbiE